MSTTSNSRTQPVVATPPPVRRMRFRFTEPTQMNRHFIQDDIVMSHLFALLSSGFPPGEEFFIRSVRAFSAEITDPVLKKRVVGFIGQEAVHGQQHRALNERLIPLGFPLARVLNFEADSRRERLWTSLENKAPRKLRLAVTAAAEHFTAVMARRILSSDEIQAIPGDPEVWNLLNWHAYEELEHKSVAFDVYRSIGGTERMRILTMAVLFYSTVPFLTLTVLASAAMDPTAWRPVTVARQTRDFVRGPMMKGLVKDAHAYMKVGYHPNDDDTEALLERWRLELFGTDAGTLIDRMK